jgi:hypothetical protein
MHAICSVSNGYLGVTHYNVCVTWWQDFFAYTLQQETKDAWDKAHVLCVAQLLGSQENDQSIP